MDAGQPELVIVRHGETEWSRQGRHTGRTDVGLTRDGQSAARGLRDRLGPMSFARVFSSPRRRALETCRLAGCGDRVELRDDLVEWDYGDYEGRTTGEIRAEHPGWSLWRDGCPGGESAPDVGRRADRVLVEVREVEGNVVVFAHGHLLRVLAARWLGLAPADGRLFVLSPGAVGVLGYERETAVVTRWNVT